MNLGVRFTSDINGYITGDPVLQERGEYRDTHRATLVEHGPAVGDRDLHQRNGERLAAGDLLQGRSPSLPATTYIASYLAPTGHFSVDRNAFRSAFKSGHLTVAANGGVFVYGSSTAFPTQTNLSSNYWVDVVLVSTPPVDTISPTVFGANPANGATGVGTSATVTITFSEALNASSVNSSTIRLLDGGTQIAATVTYNATQPHRDHHPERGRWPTSGTTRLRFWAGRMA